MKEKINAFLKSEKLKKVFKKIFNKKTVIGAILILVLAAALRIGFSLMFEVEGTVNKVEGSKITVANFLSTKTVDIANFQTSLGTVQVGDRIKIMKNLSGDIISVRDRNISNADRKGSFRENGRHGFKGKGERNSRKD
ncbi:hypothetical protein HMPREF1982_02928 [Clostridiales bacterium oral taxon 876 str. F0540]|nr:hypothetical protein HMPREF1982_02928 [Clostridiales bacterium oral taxon 876 str. F0540]